MAKKSFVSGAIILMIAGFIVRLLGFVYRIYLSNLIGAEGMGLFQLISPVYSLVILTLTSGVSIAVSKKVAEEMARNHHVNLRRITSCALGLVLTAGIIVSVFIYIYLDFIVNSILKDTRTYYSMLLLIPCIPVIAAASAVKGYFYGIQDVTPTAVSQIVEQIVRIGLVMAMAGYFVDIGLEYACALATVGMSAGEISNLAVVYAIYMRKKRKNTVTSRAGLLRKRIIFKEMLKISIPVSFNRFVTSMMYAIELIMIPRRLLAGGLDYQQSMQEYGRLTGMAVPLLFFPSLVTISLATTLVPAISEAASLKNHKALNYRITKSIQLAVVLGFVFMAVFMSYPHEIGNLVYKKEKIGDMLYMLSFTSVFIYLQQTLLGMLNGLGKQGISLRNSLIGYSIRICFVYFCIPIYGIKGYVWGMIASSVCVCFLNLYTVMNATGIMIDLRNWFLKPGIICAIMVFSGKYIYSFFTIFKLGNVWTVLAAVITNIIVSLTLMFSVGVMSKDELVRLIRFKK